MKKLLKSIRELAEAVSPLKSFREYIQENRQKINEVNMKKPIYEENFYMKGLFSNEVEMVTYSPANPRRLYFRLYREDGLGTAMTLKQLMETAIDPLEPNDKVFVSVSGDLDGPYEEIT